MMTPRPFLIFYRACEILRSGQERGCNSLALQQLHRLLVERHKGLAAKPSPLERDNAVSKISASIEDGEPGLDGRTVGHDVANIENTTDRMGYSRPIGVIGSIKHPGELAERLKANCNECG